MRTFAACLVLIASTIGILAADLSGTIIDPYLEVQTALASDNVAGAKKGAAALTVAAVALGPFAKPLADAARQIEVAKNIGEARAAFGALTDAVLAYAKGTGATLGPDVQTAYCPMQKRLWLQKGSSLRNPYYGPAMLTCGEIRK